ncbi:MAG: carboxypeptidase-like regulatory domain-containing protein [Edaphobacter sp.]
MKPLRLLVLFLCLLSVKMFAQTAEVGGAVQDQSGAVIPKASVAFRNQDTGVRHQSSTNSEGLYRFVGLEPGKYDATVQVDGFKTLNRESIVFQVGDKARIDFKMKVGGADQTVTVDGSGIEINTSDGTVSTVINREFARDMPLNGRSFQNLILLSPGVVTNTPQANGTDDGEFSVNGQRTNANYYLVDGVSANNQAFNWSGSQSSGMTASATALGTTQSILPVDAMQEFRISTSSYSAEFGRQPGAQISIQSRSGTNAYHGTAYEYLRNTVFDANNWFNTYTTPVIATPTERQNDFGGTIGGPVTIPRLFSGKDRLFFFGSYEGLRLTQPLPATIYYVPSNGTFNTATYSNEKYKNLRLNAPAALQPVLNAFPAPNCSTAQNELCVDYGDGLSPYLFSGSYPSKVNSIDVRVDAQVLPGTRVFARYTDTTSSQLSHITIGPHFTSQVTRSRVFLLGEDSVIRKTLTNELRLQYSPSSFVNAYTQDLAGGAQAANLNTLQGLPPVGGESFFYLDFANSKPKFYSLNIGSLQFQPNAVDAVSWNYKTHFFKTGVDYRQTTAYLGYKDLSRGPGVFYYYLTAAEVLVNNAYEAQTIQTPRQDPTSKNLGLFFQDEWRASPRLTVSAGLRWDLNPPPSISGAQQYGYAGDIHNPSSLTLSQFGAPFYKTSYTQFQPRLGMAFIVHNQPGHETVLRGGAGLFYDLIALNQAIGTGESLGAGNHIVFSSTAKPQFPLPINVILAPTVLPPPPPYTLSYVADPHLISPTTIHWNAALEQAFGLRQTLTVGYVGSEGRNLVNETEYSIAKLNPLFGTIVQYENGPGSNYNSLQVQYKYQARHDLQFLASYTWSHAIDSSSSDDLLAPLQRGNSDHDVRNNFSSALVYNLPGSFPNRWERILASNWNFDLFVILRSGFPVEQAGASVVDPATGNEYVGRLSYNGKNPYVYKAGIPGGRQVDPSVFSVPTASENGNGNAPRNFLRGFGAAVADTSIQRNFPLHDQIGLLFRAEAFNILNHPNFGTLNVSCGSTTAGATCTNPLMGQATNMLGTALSNVYGGTGLASIYQQGGPRSLQFVVKLQF